MRGALLLFALVLASGCVIAGCDPGPAVSARNSTATGREAGDGGFFLEVRPTDGINGGTVLGAAVVAYWGDDDSNAWGDASVRVGPDGVYVGAGGADVVVAPGILVRSPDALNVAAARTDEMGVVGLHLPSNRIVGIVAAAPGFTEEWVASLPTGGDDQTGRLAIPLFRAAGTTFVNQTTSPGTVHAQVTEIPWYPLNVEFGNGPAEHQAYLARMVGLSGTLRWTNGIMGGGDLGLGLGIDGPVVDSGGVGTDAATPGAKQTTLTMSLSELDQAGFIGAPLRAGPTVQTIYVAPFGMDTSIQLDGAFDRELALITKCGVELPQPQSQGNTVPGFEVVIGLLVLAGLAFISARRGL